MFISMLKKEIKQFCRSKSNIIMLFVFPVLLITTLSVGLKSLMTASSNDIFGDENGKPDIVYYTTLDENKYNDGFNLFKEGIESQLNVKFYETDSLDNVKEKVDNYDGLIHINISQNGFELYSSSSGENFKTKIIRGIFETILNDYATYETIGRLSSDKINSIVQSEYDNYVEKDNKTVGRNVTSSEYYTFAELALIILYVSITVGESVYKENQLKTINRIRLSKVSEYKLIGCKITLGILIAILQTLLIYFYSSYVLDVNWGENTIKFILLFIVFGIFASVLGTIIGITAKKDTSVNSISNVIIFTLCTFGGCYTPLSMILSIPLVDKIAYLSPIYWINTATSSMICGYQSDAYIIALLIPIILSIILVMFYLIIMRIKGGIQSV